MAVNPPEKWREIRHVCYGWQEALSDVYLELRDELEIVDPLLARWIAAGRQGLA